MARPRGMYKKDDLWYMADGSLARSSAAKVNATIAPVITTPEKPAQRVTEPLQQVPVVRNYGTRLYSQDDLKTVENTTGLACVGFFADNGGIQIPVFLKAEHSEDDMSAKLTKIRKGI